ncbi:hypothetical protein BJY52DRAFT_1245691 [Lactarius psammicola]|nr:hypothetical protein BJY52DRAFT_1245691 [Lactarius psammicola]
MTSIGFVGESIKIALFSRALYHDCLQFIWVCHTGKPSTNAGVNTMRHLTSFYIRKRSRHSDHVRSSVHSYLCLSQLQTPFLSHLPFNARRRLHRRSSCSSIPRSVSACSSVEAYMAPLFRGLEGLREARDEATEQDVCDPSIRSQFWSRVTSLRAIEPFRGQPLPGTTPPVPGLPRPLVLAEVVRQDPPSTGTRPLRIDRSKKRQEQGGGPQRTPRADAPYVRPPARTIYRAATQVNLREAYRRASPHSADKAGQTRHIPVARPPPLGPLPEIPHPGVNKVFNKRSPCCHTIPSGLIPLEHAQDKFRHAHCLDRLPPSTQDQSDIANPPTPSSENRSLRTLGWSFGRAFRKQKA